MNSEKEIIEQISALLPRSDRQVNRVFESDSEIILEDGTHRLFTTDEYSEEDHFNTEDPGILGWNLAIATISDIYASGGIPTYYSHVMSLDRSRWDHAFIRNFTVGLSEALKKAGAFFIGGDLGWSEKWHYTGIAMGTATRPLTRKGAFAGDYLFMTGRSGDGNLQAAAKMFAPQFNFNSKFELRHEEAKLISTFAASCIDTSDGLLNSLLLLSEINETGFLIENPNLDEKAAQTIEKLGLDRKLLFMGECGEYELLFTIRENKLNAFLEEAQKRNLEFTELGKLTTKPSKLLRQAETEIDFSEFRVRGRDYYDVKEYISELIQYIKSHENHYR